mmetsp:Transcript_85697/g.239509  ORF Transcript_85697/g.239509 Transcript_85697/m.239509 type:complete len:216 (+) Transcript_85697:91-738(+)
MPALVGSKMLRPLPPMMYNRPACINNCAPPLHANAPVFMTSLISTGWRGSATLNARRPLPPATTSVSRRETSSHPTNRRDTSEEYPMAPVSMTSPMRCGSRGLETSKTPRPLPPAMYMRSPINLISAPAHALDKQPVSMTSPTFFGACGSEMSKIAKPLAPATYMSGCALFVSSMSAIEAPPAWPSAPVPMTSPIRLTLVTSAMSKTAKPLPPTT